MKKQTNSKRVMRKLLITKIRKIRLNQYFTAKCNFSNLSSKYLIGTGRWMEGYLIINSCSNKMNNMKINSKLVKIIYN